MKKIRPKRIAASILGCLAVLILSDRATASGVTKDFDFSSGHANSSYLLASNLAESGASLAENSAPANETTDGLEKPLPPQDSPLQLPPRQTPARPNTVPANPNNQEPGNPIDSLPPLELPLPPAPEPEAPEKPEQPKSPQQEEQPAPKPTLPVPRALWSEVTATSPLFGTETVTEFSEQKFNQGKWGLHPHFGLSTVYDGNVFIKNNDRQSGLIALASAGLGLQVGNSLSPISLTLDYTVGLELFLQQSSENKIDQTASLDLRWSLRKLTLDFRGSVSAGTGTSIDIGNRVTRNGYSFGISGNYELTAKTSINVNLTENLADYGGYIGSSTTRLDAFANYQFRPKLSLGAGGALSYLSVQGGSGQTAEELAVRAVYSATEKLTFNANGGLEVREYSSGISDTVTPVFGIGANWMVREGTQITLNASRHVFNSASLDGQNYIATGGALGIRQRFTDRCNLTFDVGYANLDYQAAGQNISASRVDNYFYIRPGFEVRMTSYCSLAIYYEYSRDDSNKSSYSFQRDRVGLQVNLRF